MSRFNPTKVTTIENLAGGRAHQQTKEVELASILLTSFVQDQFYRSSVETLVRLSKLIADCDKEFVAKAAIYTRQQFGMRSISHFVASELAKHISGQEWGKRFYEKVIKRPDDITEILAIHLGKKQKVSAAMKKGLAAAFDKFDKYQLAKYRGEGKGIKLVDAVNIVHPKPVEKNKEALDLLIKGELKSFDTWESDLTRAGQNASNEKELAELKKDVWVDLISTGKIGYFALLRNMRNVLQQAPEIVNKACDMLEDRVLIKKSLILPFQFMTAYKEIANMSADKNTRKVLVSISKAIDLAVDNVPEFDGDTLVCLDVSGSMGGRTGEIATLFAAVICKRNNCDLMTFEYDAHYAKFSPASATVDIVNNMRFPGGSTNFHSIFNRANRRYDRIIILSDMQGWVGYNTPAYAFRSYRRKYDVDPFVYSFDLAGHGSLQFPEKNVFCLAGFSDKVFDIMKLLEQDRDAMVNTIKKVEL